MGIVTTIWGLVTTNPGPQILQTGKPGLGGTGGFTGAWAAAAATKAAARSDFKIIVFNEIYAGGPSVDPLFLVNLLAHKRNLEGYTTYRML